MNESSSFGYPEGPASAQPPAAPMNPAQYRFSPDELRVLQECNRDSFFQRSVPLGTALGLGAFAAVQTGHLKPNPRFGAFPKMTLAVIVGYFLGKLSYQQACAEKLMALPGSYIGQLLRDRRDGKSGGGTVGLPTHSPSMYGAGPSDIYSDAGPGSSLNLDTDRPIFNDDTTYRPDSDKSAPEPPQSASQPSQSYEELRRRNRGEYANTKQEPYRTEVPPSPRRAPPAATNKYGDVVE